MTDQTSTSAGGGSTKGTPLESVQAPPISSIDDAVSMIRSVEAAPEIASSSASNMIRPEVQDVLLPALKRQYHSQKGKGQRVFLQALQGGYDPLAMLDPTRNTLGYAFILACRSGHAADLESAQLLTEYIDAFARTFTPAQLIGAGEIVTVLARSIAHVGQLLGNPIGALTSLVRLFDGFRSVQGGVNNLSTLHPIIVYQCLRAQHYHAAVDWVLQYDVISADEHITALAYTDVLEYLYYGGMVWARVNRLDKACEFFELCVTSPAQQVSAIQLDAYKKLLLLQLLKDGKTTPLPRYTSQAVTRAIRSRIASVDVYQNIAKAYEAEPTIKMYSGNMEHTKRQAMAVQETLEREVSKATEVLGKDLNVGLVKQSMAMLTRRKIQRLSRLFNRTKVGHIVDLLGGSIEGAVGDDAGRIVLSALQQMNADAWTRVDVENPDAASPMDVTVRFADVEVAHSGREARQRLTKIMQEGKFWDQVVELKHKSVRSSEGYLTKVRMREEKG